MQGNDHAFAARSDGDVLALVRNHPMAWIVSGAGEDLNTALMPFRPWRTEGDRIISLASHLPRRSPQVEQLQRDPRADLLFLGAHGYVSPSWLEDRSQAPTWNFISARFRVRIDFMSDPDQLRALLEDLVNGMESGRRQAWAIEEMGDRFDRLASRIVGFTAQVQEVEPRFKLGQDERDDVFADMCAGLDRSGDQELLRWMRDFRD